MNSQTNWKPFILFAGLLGLLFLLGLGLTFWTGVHTSGVWWPGMWGMGFFWVFPAFGFVMMLVMMFFFFSVVIRSGGPMDKFGNSDSQHTHLHTSQRQSNKRCPTCDSPVQADWKVYPYCGTKL